MANGNTSSSSSSSSGTSGNSGAAGLVFVSGIVDYFSAKKAAKKLGKIAAKRYQLTLEASNRAFLRTASDIRTRTQEERSQIAIELESLVRSALEAKGFGVAAAGAGSVAGVSVDDALSDIGRQAADRGAGLTILQRFRERAAEREIGSVRERTRLQQLGALPAPVAGPDFTSSFLRAAAGAASVF